MHKKTPNGTNEAVFIEQENPFGGGGVERSLATAPERFSSHHLRTAQDRGPARRAAWLGRGGEGRKRGARACIRRF